MFYSVAINAQSNSSKPNILWITCEDISPFIACYGDKVVKTPNIDQLAKEGVRYTNVYTTAGVCAPSRSAIITGMYQTSIGTQHMRTSGDPKYQPVPSYAAVIPDYVKCFPEYLRMNGYYCTNNEKQDYQFTPPVTVWDENGAAASFRNRPEDKPFFAVFNFMITHESQLYMREKDSLLVDPNVVTVPPFYPDTKTVRKGIARNYSNIELMDKQVGELIKMLKDDGLYENTIIFFYSDHGGALPWMKREVLERGIHIPFVIRFPQMKNAGTINDDMISAVDFAPTVLSLAGVTIPSYMQGQAFLGTQAAKQKRKYVFAARDRMDTEYDRVRAVRDEQYEYIYNYEPEKPYYQAIEFRMSIPMMKEIMSLHNEGKLDSIPESWFKSKPVDELYDVKNDPNQLHNLVNDPTYAAKLKELKAALKDWLTKVGDMSSKPEKDMIATWWNGKSEPPVTSEPVIAKSNSAVTITCATKGASIGYQVIKAGADTTSVMHKVTSWDMSTVLGRSTVKELLYATPWQVYNGEPIKLEQGDTLKVNAMRIGYKPATTTYTY